MQDRSYNPHLRKIDIWEVGHEYQELEFREEWRDCNIIIGGYRQTEKYFKDYRSELLYLFDIPYEKVERCSIHARFGDYLTVQKNGKFKHVLVDDNYLTMAMALVTEKTGITSFKIFSDDIPLFKQRHGHLADFEYSTNNNEWDDLVEISCHAHQIGSSSTFSWWGAWLNRNPEKVIVTQQHWFHPDGWDGLETKDIIPEEWCKL